MLWVFGNLEARLTPLAPCNIPWAIPDYFLQRRSVHCGAGGLRGRSQGFLAVHCFVTTIISIIELLPVSPLHVVADKCKHSPADMKGEKSVAMSHFQEYFLCHFCLRTSL